MLLQDWDSDCGAVTVSVIEIHQSPFGVGSEQRGVATLEVIVKSHHFLHSTAVRFATGYQVLVPNQLVVGGKALKL